MKTSKMLFAVLGYSALDLLLLLSTLLRSGWGDLAFARYSTLVFISQLILIPGLAALFSVLLYGQHRWKRRTLGVLLVGALIPVLTGVALVAPVAVSAATLTEMHWMTLFLVIGTPVVWTIIWLVRTSRKWAMNREAERWSRERQEIPDRSERRWQLRRVRIASAIPVLLVLPVFVFFFPLWGLLTRLGYPHATTLAGFEFKPPQRAVIVGAEIVDQHASYASGVAACYPTTRQLLRPQCLYGWSVGTSASSRDDRFETPRIVASESLRVAGEELVCRKFALGFPKGETERRCVGSGRLRASFWGPTDQLPRFFEMIRSIQRR